MRKYVVRCLFSTIAMIVGCSTLGPSYTPIKSIPEGQSLIYIFYPLNPKIPAENPTFYILNAGEPIVKLEKGGYFPYFVQPGKLTLTSKVAFKYGVSGALDVVASPENSITLQVRKGQTYYIEGVVYADFGFFREFGLGLNQVSDEFQAQLMLEECKQLPKYVPPK